MQPEQTAQAPFEFDAIGLELVEEAPQAFEFDTTGLELVEEAPPADQDKGFLSDTGNLLAAGVNRAAQNVRELVGRIPVVGEGLLAAGDAADRFLSGKDSETLLRENEQKYQQNLTPEMRGAQQKLWWDEETGSLGSAWTDPRAYASGIIQSLPEMAISMGAAGRLAKGAYARALAKTGDKAAAAKAAARMATVAGGVSEGLLGGADTARQVRDQIAAMPLEQLQQSEAFQTLLEEGLQPEEARAQLAEDSATQGLLIAGAATGVFGGMGDRALANLLTGRVTAGIGGRIAKGAIGEGLLEELPQSMGQQLAENYVMQDADPSRELGAGVLNAGLGGLATGAVMGGGLGAVATSRTGPSDADPAAAQDLATPEATFENTPEPAALPAPGLQGLPPPEPVFYADRQGNVQDTGPVRNVDGEQRPEPQARQWVNPQNDPARMPGGPGMDQPTPRGEPAPLAGEFQHGSRPAAPGRAAAEPATVDAAPERQALPAPDSIVVDSQGNAQRGPTGPFVAPQPERPLPGGRGMDQQAPTADSSGAPDLEIRLRKNGKPFQGRLDARGSLLYRNAAKAGEQPQVVRHGDGWAVAVPKQQAPQPLRPARPIDQQADQAATSPNNDLPAPTPAQIEAGNYRKGHVRVAGLDIAIENPRGSERSGKRPDGTEWRHTMSDHYGYIKRTVGADQEQVDVYLGPQEDSDQVFIVDQLHQQDGSFDEHKVMLGYPNQAAAVEAYRSNFDPDWKVGEVTAMPVEQFKRWLKEGDLAKPAQAHAGPAAGAVAEQGAAASYTPYADSYRQAVIDEYIADGVTPDVAERLASKPRFSAPIDATTGLFEGRREAEDGSTDTERAIGRAIEYVAATDGEAYWVSADIANLGGLNAHFNNVARDANKHYRALADIVRKELGAVGQVEGFRTGGDEFGALVIGGERAAVEAALDRARQAAAAYTRSEGLDKIIHPKHPDDESKRGVGLHLGVAQIAPIGSPSSIMALADKAMDQSKKGTEHVSGIQAATSDRALRDQRPSGTGEAPERAAGSPRASAAGDGRTPSGEAGPAAADRVSDTPAETPAASQAGSDTESRYSLDTGPRPAGVDAAAVRQALAASPELASIQVVQSFDDLPLSVRTRAGRDGVRSHDMRGVFRPDAQYLVADNQQDLEEAIRTAVHEMVGHQGIRGLLGDQLNGTLERIYSSEMARTTGRQRVAQIREHYASVLEGKSAAEQRLLIAEEIIAHLAESGDRPTVLQRVASKIRELLRKLFPQVNWTYTDVLALIEQSRDWLRAQQRQAQPGQRSDGQRYALSPEPAEAQAYREQLKAALRVPGRIDRQLSLGRTPLLYQLLGAQDLSVTIAKDTVLKASNGVKHQVPGKVIEQLPELLADPVMVFSSATQEGSLVSLIEALDEFGRPVIVALQLNSRSGRVIVNRIASLYGKEGIDGFVRREISNGRLLYRHAEKSREWLQSRGLQLPKEGTTHGSAQTILTEQDVVNASLSPHEIRDRLAAAKFRGLGEVDGRAVGDRSGTEAPVDPSEDTRYSLRSKRPHVSEAFADLSQAERDALGKIAPPTARQRATLWFRERADRAMTKIRQGLVDRYAALKELDEKAHGLDFLDTSITSSAWVLARMAPAAAGALNAMMHNGRIVLDPQQKVIGMREDGSMGLGEVLGRLGDAKEIERFFGWVAGNRAAKLAAEGRENLFTAQDIEALKGINRGVTEDGRTRASLYDEVFKEFQQYRDDVLAIAEQTGIISSENRAMWRDEFYVPFYRVMDEEAKAKGPVSSKGLSRQEAYKKLKGGKQNLNDLLENTLMNFHHLLTASLKNQAAAQTIANAERLQIARKVPEAARDPKTSTFVLEKGEKVWYEVDDALVFEALSSLADPGLNNFAVRTMAKFKRVFTNMTTITPQFIIANFLRDSMQAAATTPVSKNVPANMFQGLKSFRDQKTRAQMLASGGAFSFGHIYGADPEEVKAGLKRSLRGAKLLDAPALVPKLLVAGWDAYNEAANTAENANRAAAFLQNQDKGALRAAYEARDLMDFSQEGAWPAVRFLIRVVPFLNARLQGLDKLYRSGFKPAVKVAFGKGTNSDKVAAARFAAVTGALALASLALYLANHDDEEYRKLEDWQKDSFWFFRVGDNGFFLPKPFEVGAISTLVERLAEQAVDDKASGKLFRERLWAMLTQTFSFSPVPQMFQPALDVYSNRDAFTNRPIESAGMEKLSPTLRDRASSTAPAKAISSATALFGEDFALSPLQADHLIRGYLGQVGAWGAGLIDTVWRAASGESEPAKRWHEYQPIRRFYRDLGAPAPYDRYSTLFYEGLKESGRVYADAKRLQELGRKDEARELVQEKRQVLAMRKPLAEVQRQLSGINARMDMVRRSDWDGDRKRRELDRLQAIKSRLTERAGKRIEEARARE